MASILLLAERLVESAVRSDSDLGVLENVPLYLLFAASVLVAAIAERVPEREASLTLL